MHCKVYNSTSQFHTQILKDDTRYHLILHCAVRSAGEMLSVAPTIRDEDKKRNLRSILKAGMLKVGL